MYKFFYGRGIVFNMKCKGAADSAANVLVKKKKGIDAGANRDGYLFLLPWLIGFFGLYVIPFIASFVLSFTDYSIMGDLDFIGLDNYKRMFFEDDKFWTSLGVTFKYVAVTVPLKLAFALAVAMILNSKRKGIGLYRTVYYLPSLIGGSVAVAVVWKQLFSNDGAINMLLESIGMSSINWFTDPNYAMWTLVAMAVWQFGAPMLIFLSALKQINPTYYEAARIDGATGIQMFFKITVPNITPVLFYNLIMQIIGAFSSFTQSYVVTEGGPLDSTLFYALHLYRQSFEYFDMGYGSAMAWFLLLIIAFFTALIFKSSSYWVFYEEKGE